MKRLALSAILLAIGSTAAAGVPNVGSAPTGVLGSNFRGRPAPAPTETESRLLTQGEAFVSGYEIKYHVQPQATGEFVHPIALWAPRIEFTVWYTPSSCDTVKNEGFLLKSIGQSEEGSVYELQEVTTAGLISKPCRAIASAPKQVKVTIPLKEIAAKGVTRFEFMAGEVEATEYKVAKLKTIGRRSLCVTKDPNAMQIPAHYTVVDCK